MKEVARNVGRRYNLTTHRQSWHRDDVPASRPVPTPPISSRPCIDPSIASGRSPFPSRRPTKHLVSVHRRRSRCLVSPLLVSSHPIQRGTYYTDTTAHARSVGSGRSARRYVIRVASCPVAGQPRVHMYIAASSTTKLCFAAGAVSSSPASVLLHTSSRPARRQENPARWIPQRERWVAGALARRKRDKGKAVRASLGKVSTWGVGWVTRMVFFSRCLVPRDISKACSDGMYHSRPSSLLLS
jgi:hypothetical protein